MALPASEREQAAAFVEVGRVRGGPAVAVEHPAIRNLPIGVSADPDLALGHDAGGDVDQQRLGSRGDGDSYGIRRQARLGTSPGSHPADAVTVAVYLGDEPPLGRSQGIDPDTPDVVAVAKAQRGDPVFFGLCDAELDGLHGGHLSPGIVSVKQGGGGRLPDDLDPRPGLDLALADVGMVLGQPDDPVRVMSRQLGLDKVSGDDEGILARTAHRLDQVS